MGGRLEFVDLQHELKDKGIDWDLPICCDSQKSNYSFLRVQMRGDFSFHREKGVWIEDAEHDEKCLRLLRLAKKRYCDLVLFPEYCISEQVIVNIIEDESLWPENHKLWVLPCQGMEKEKFDSLIKKLSDLDGVFLLDTACNSWGVLSNRFVNALFYCFLACRDGKPTLCLVPQLKTQPMGDRNCLCEQAGMTIGNMIFTLGNRLLTLLCADSMNNELTWQALQNEGLQMSGLTILHPQLNGHPKDAVVSRLRWELFEHGKAGTYITCNWAAGTTLSRSGRQEAEETLALSWSCVYLKHADDISEKWEKKTSLHRENEQHGLFGAIMKPKRTEVWFSQSQEEALELIVPNFDQDGYGKTSVSDVHAQVRCCYDQDTQSWVEQAPSTKTLQQRIDRIAKKNPALYQSSCDVEDAYRFPLDTEERWDADRFFALALEAFPNNILEIDETENLSAWTLLLDEEDRKSAATQFDHFLYLIDILQGELPAQCAPLKAPHSFCYQTNKSGRPSINLRAAEQEALVAYAQTPHEARQYAKFLRDTECNGDEDLLRQFIRVFYFETKGRRLACEPVLSAEITQGRGTIVKGDITDGGIESDA